VNVKAEIRVLPEHLSNKIAAGEVVQRPASVAKELMENALDAGADNILVQIENGGIDLIKIVDNGTGMTERDALLSLQRHATSKISGIEDHVQKASFRWRFFYYSSKTFTILFLNNRHAVRAGCMTADSLCRSANAELH